MSSKLLLLAERTSISPSPQANDNIPVEQDDDDQFPPPSGTVLTQDHEEQFISELDGASVTGGNDIIRGYETMESLFTICVLVKMRHSSDYYKIIRGSNPKQMPTFNIDREEAKLLTLNWTGFLIHSALIYHTEWSNLDNHQMFVDCIQEWFALMVRALQRIKSDVECILVLEHSVKRKWHVHMLTFIPEILNTKQKREFNDYFSEIAHKHGRKVSSNSMGYLVTHTEWVKSNGGIINYLQKRIMLIYTSDIRLAKMLLTFDRTFIFNAASQPKKRPNPNEIPDSHNELVNFFNSRLADGISDISEALKHPNALYYLSISNLDRIFENCKRFYLANRSFKQSLQEMFIRFNKLPEWHQCACPVFELLNYQNVNITIFRNQLMQWLNCNTKRNTLVFIGAADTGKSVIGNALMACFRFSKKLSQDGIFTFANIIGQDMCLWEEPFITTELSDTAKNVLEGNPNTTISIKNQSSVKIGKKIPIVVTTNKQLYHYCSGDAPAYDARSYIVNFNRNMSNVVLCNDVKSDHTCFNINADCFHRSHNEDSEDFCQQRKRFKVDHTSAGVASSSCGDDIIDEPTECTIHKLYEYHMLSFIIHLILTHPNSAYSNFIDTYPNSLSKLCYCTINYIEHFNVSDDDNV